MKPIEWLSVWNPLQQHAAQTFLEETSIFFLAYEMPRRWGKTTLLEDLIVKAFLEERKVDILLISPTSAAKCQSSNRIDNLTRKKTIFRYPLSHFYQALHTRLYCIDLLDDPRGMGGQWIFIDDCNDMDPEYFFKHLVPILQLPHCRVFWPFSGKEPFPMQYLRKHFYEKMEVKTFFLDYSNATRRAIHAWIICAKRMGLHQDVFRLIAIHVEETRHNPVWVNVEYAK